MVFFAALTTVASSGVAMKLPVLPDQFHTVVTASIIEKNCEYLFLFVVCSLPYITGCCSSHFQLKESMYHPVYVAPPYGALYLCLFRRFGYDAGEL